MPPETVAMVSVDEFWAMAHRLARSELVGGRVVEMAPPGGRHGALVVRFTVRLEECVTTHRLGIVLGETGFILQTNPATVRAPDVAVMLTPPVPLPARFIFGPPDLAVEILSPDDRPGEVAAKIADFLRAGSQAVWIVDPDGETVTVHTPTGATLYQAGETLDGAPVLPAFRAPVRALLLTTVP